MFRISRLLSRIPRGRPAPGPGADLPPLPVPSPTAVAAALGMDLTRAHAIATRAAAHQRQVLAGPRLGRPGAALRRLRRAARRHALPRLPAGPGLTVVTLPLTRAAVAFAAGLAQEGRELRVLRTAASAAFLEPFLAGHPRARLCGVPELLAHARAAAGAGEAAVYLTFPEHLPPPAGASRTVTLLGEAHQVSVLEALLLGRGARLLAADVDRGRARLAECPAALARDSVSEADLDAVAAWVAGCAERVVAAAPAELLTWAYLERQRAGVAERARAISVNSLKGFLRVWRAAGAGLPDEVYGWSLAELERLREARTSPATVGGAA